MKALKISGVTILFVIGALCLLALGPQQTGGGQGGSASGSGTVSANSGSANTVAGYAAAAGSTTVGPFAGLTYSLPTLTVSVAGSGNGALALSGTTSGAASFTAPAVAGTATNAVTSTNAIQVPTGTQYQIGTDSGISRDNAKIFDFGSGTQADATGTLLASGHGSKLVSTAAITGPVPVKADTANAAQVVVTTTTDTGAGIAIGVCANSPGAGGNCYVLSHGGIALTLGTGTCAIGNFVIVDTTTNGRVKCTATFTAGTVIGVAISAQGSVGSAVTTAVGLR